MPETHLYQLQLNAKEAQFVVLLFAAGPNPDPMIQVVIALSGTRLGEEGFNNLQTKMKLPNKAVMADLKSEVANRG